MLEDADPKLILNNPKQSFPGSKGALVLTLLSPYHLFIYLNQATMFIKHMHTTDT